MPPLLEKDQKIIYCRNGQPIAELTSSNIGELDLELQQYIRLMQPFAEAGPRLGIPRLEEDPLLTGQVQKIERGKNTLTFTTRKSTYEIRYVNIDLEAILRDGKNWGLNASDGVNLPPFPYRPSTD